MRRSFACALSLSVLSTLIVGGLPGTAAASPGAAEPPAEGHTITLITGDRVRLDGTGPAQRATVVRTAPGTTSFLTFRERDHLYVVPDQAAGPLGDGRLDRRLFDLTGLVAAGYDDRARPSLPLIIGYDERQPRTLALPAGTARIRDLPSIAGSAVDAHKPNLDEFWAQTERTAQVARIWLDAPVHGALDRSVAQIGGPAARARGYTGTGVKVAVLDSGLDANHPDFAGRVGPSANFTTEPDTEDRLGHGTHVASIALGSGAGSGGQFQGVAPGATLLVGKVLERRIVHPGIPVGVGAESWIIAGMEWAAAQGAQVVNLSLGGLPGDGDDPMSAAVNRLTAASGALFVVAAGNSGSDGPYSVGAPAVADAALAVGNVDRDDSLNWTSSRGPRPGDDAIKPELTAPGVQIMAARAGGTEVDLYRTMSGTSMASPHVAGAAALLKQQHPDWTAQQLRAALTSTADANPELDVHAQGAGRVDVDRATAQHVYADTGVLNLGYFAKDAAPPRATKRITYRNDTTEPVTLDLTVSGKDSDGNPIPAGMLTAGAAKVTVPAGGTAPVDVTADTSAGGPGNYGGALVATGPDGLRIGTAIGFTKQGDFVDVTFRGIDRNGDPTPALVSLQNLAPPNQMRGQYVFIAPTGSRTVRLPAGRYALFGAVRTMDASGRFVAHNTVALDPELEVDRHNFTVTLDARQGRDLGVRVPRDADLEGMSIGMEVNRPNLPAPYQGSVSLARGPRALGPPMRPAPASIIPFAPPTQATVNVDTEWHLRAPVVRAEIRRPRNVELSPLLMRGSSPVTGRSTVDVVDAGSGRPEDLRGKDLRGKAAVVRETPGLTFDEQAGVVSEAGARVALISSAQPGLFDGVLRDEPPPMPVLAISQADGDRLRAGRRTTVEVWGDEVAPYRYDLLFRDRNRLAASMVKSVDHWRLAEVRARYHTLGPTKGARMSVRRSPADASPCGYCGFVLPGADGEVTSLEEFTGALTRTEYVTPGVDWREDVYPVGMGVWAASTRAYRTGPTDLAWQRAPIAAGVPVVPGMRSERDGDQLRFRLGAFTDSDPRHWARARFIPRQPVRLYRDGVEVGSCGDEGELLCDLDVKPGAANYELRATILGDAFSWDVGQKSVTAWTFRSDTAATPAALPLIDVDYLFPLDGEQSARAGRWFVGGIGARHQPGSTAPKVRSMRLSVSYDDGATWRPARVDRLYGEQFLVSYRHPDLAASNGFVALRLEAADAAGNKLSQTVHRAYRLG